jgi:uncharacterized membrane protein
VSLVVLKKYQKSRKLILSFLALFLIFLLVFTLKSNWIKALTKNFVQTDWSGGADIEATINDSNLSGWTKFYSKDSSVSHSTEGEIKLRLDVTQPE